MLCICRQIVQILAAGLAHILPETEFRRVTLDNKPFIDNKYGPERQNASK
jgi:hypothetical protein